MASFKKLMKIQEEFSHLFLKYEEALESENDREIIKYTREIFAFISKHRKTLEISDETINEFDEIISNYEKSTTEAEIAEAKAAESNRKFEISKERYFKALLELPPIGKKRINH